MSVVDAKYYRDIADEVVAQEKYHEELGKAMWQVSVEAHRGRYVAFYRPLNSDEFNEVLQYLTEKLSSPEKGYQVSEAEECDSVVVLGVRYRTIRIAFGHSVSITEK
jgi:hypothetical protein